MALLAEYLHRGCGHGSKPQAIHAHSLLFKRPLKVRIGETGPRDKIDKIYSAQSFVQLAESLK